MVFTKVVNTVGIEMGHDFLHVDYRELVKNRAGLKVYEQFTFLQSLKKLLRKTSFVVYS